VTSPPVICFAKTGINELKRRKKRRNFFMGSNEILKYAKLLYSLEWAQAKYKN
jgi:hypothetical protein